MLPFRIERIQTDNGAEFQSAFHYHVLDRGIGYVYIRPATPRLNGKVERSHRIDAEEFDRMLDGVVIDDAFNDRIRESEDFDKLQPIARRSRRSELPMNDCGRRWAAGVKRGYVSRTASSPVLAGAVQRESSDQPKRSMTSARTPLRQGQLSS